MAVSERRKGELYVFSEILLWAFFPIVTTLSFTTLPSLVSFGWSAVCAAVFFGCVALYRRTWREWSNRELWKYIFFITLFNGVLYYACYFIGLKSTTPGNAALLAQFEIATTFIFFNLFRREYIARHHIVGIALMAVGTAVVLVPHFSGFNRGDVLILFAQVIAPFGNLYQQKARRIVASESILFLRTLCSVPIIFLLAYILGESSTLSDVKMSLGILVLNGALLLGFQKILFLEAIHRIPVSRVMAFGALGPFLTLMLAWAILGQLPTLWQLSSLVPFVIGTLLLTDQLRLRMN